ncbi:protein MNN4-like [Leptopilina heterotoma]|uniref:protein MNN4-like n=1 Tax=Leptopilina heterotoma TaxID=63436 RepID=UPI001CA8B066|nr:protein MNN4-like [Leptopilina heterotoma]
MLSSRKIAHEKWMLEKEQRILKLKEKKRQAEKMKQEEEEKIKSEKEEKERRDQETFVRWIERKKHEQIVKQQILRRELELQKRLKDIEDKAVVAKTIYLRQWARKKEDDHKKQQKKQHLKEQQKDEEKKKRVEESNKAYGEWREKSKIKPKPATQGLLPHQKARPAFVNPNPWQDIIEIDEINKELIEKK